MKEPPDCHDQRKSQIEDDAIARAEELEGERTITKYLEQKLYVKGEHSLLETIDNTVSKIDQLTRERDAAIKEASRRDEKWMSGINEIIGSKLDYHDPCARNNASKALGDLVRERDEARAAAAAMRNVINLAMTQLRESFSGRGLKNYMAVQFPATEGHIPFAGFCDDIDAAFKTLFDAQLSTSVGPDFLSALKECVAVLDKFVAKVESGRARSTETYNEAKQALAKAQEALR